jgi:hypothetical protein
VGLDKWLKPDETEKKSKIGTISSDPAKRNKVKRRQKTSSEKPMSKLSKFTLSCPNAKCKYQKTLMKKQLTEIDRICPRCKKEMKVK